MECFMDFSCIAHNSEATKELAVLLINAVRGRYGTKIYDAISKKVGVSDTAVYNWGRKSEEGQSTGICAGNFVKFMEVLEEDYPDVMDENTVKIQRIYNENLTEKSTQSEIVGESVCESAVDGNMSHQNKAEGFSSEIISVQSEVIGESTCERAVDEDVSNQDETAVFPTEIKPMQSEVIDGSACENAANMDEVYQQLSDALTEEYKLRIEAQQKSIELQELYDQEKKKNRIQEERIKQWETKYCEINADLLKERRKTQSLQERCDEYDSKLSKKTEECEESTSCKRGKDQIVENDRRNRLYFHVFSLIATITGILVIVLPKTVPNKSVEVFSLLVVVFASAAFDFIGIVDPNGWGDVDISLKRFMGRKKRGEVR